MRKIIWLVVNNIYVQPSVFYMRKSVKLYILQLKKYYFSHGMCWCCSFHFCYMANKILLSLEVCFAIRGSGSLFLFTILWLFLVGLGNCSEFFGCFINAEIQRKLTICWVYETEHARICSLYVTIREQNHNHSKISRGYREPWIIFLTWPFAVIALGDDRVSTEVVRPCLMFLWVQTVFFQLLVWRKAPVVLVDEVHFLITTQICLPLDLP